MAKGKSNRIFVWIIMGLLMFGMIGFGATGLSGRISSVGTVGDLPVEVTAYSSELRGQMASASAQFGQQISFAQAQAFGIPNAALSQVISQRVLDNEMRQLEISVGDETVREAVVGNLSFAGPDGVFNRENYRALLRDNGLTEAQYENAIRDDNTRALIQVAVISGLPEPQIYAQTLANFLGERRDFTWATLEQGDLAEPVGAPSDAQLQTFYDENPDLFTSLETKALTYVWLTPAMIQDQVTIDEEELRQEYQDRIAEFVVAERRLVERLVFSDAESAETALAAITAGESDFDTLVAERGLQLSDIDLGDVSEDDLGSAGAAVFAAEPGAVVGPVETDFGPALMRMNAILSARNTTFEEAIPDLREDQAAARAGRIIEDQIDPITDLLAGGARLEDLAERTDMVLGQLDWTRETETEIAAYAEFRDAVADLEPGTFPELLELEDGGLFAVRVDDVTEPTLQPLDEVRETALPLWQAAETQRQIVAQAEDMAAQIDAETEFTEIGLADAIAERDLTRRDFLNGTPPGFMDRVFELSVGETVVVEGTENAIVLRLDAVAPPPEGDAAVEAETAGAAAAAGEAIARDVFNMLNDALSVQTEIEINDAAINAVHANFQ